MGEASNWMEDALYRLKELHAIKLLRLTGLPDFVLKAALKLGYLAEDDVAERFDRSGTRKYEKSCVPGWQWATDCPNVDLGKERCRIARNLLNGKNSKLIESWTKVGSARNPHELAQQVFSHLSIKGSFLLSGKIPPTASKREQQAYRNLISEVGEYVEKFGLSIRDGAPSGINDVLVYLKNADLRLGLGKYPEYGAYATKGNDPSEPANMLAISLSIFLKDQAVKSYHSAAIELSSAALGCPITIDESAIRKKIRRYTESSR